MQVVSSVDWFADATLTDKGRPTCFPCRLCRFALANLLQGIGDVGGGERHGGSGHPRKAEEGAAIAGFPPCPCRRASRRGRGALRWRSRSTIVAVKLHRVPHLNQNQTIVLYFSHIILFVSVTCHIINTTPTLHSRAKNLC